jgi:CTD small phosphatase-like protein 2
VVIFTASQKVYANALLDLLDPAGNLMHHRLFREACLFVQGNFLKDLSVLDRDLSKVRVLCTSNFPFLTHYHFESFYIVLHRYSRIDIDHR